MAARSVVVWQLAGGDWRLEVRSGDVDKTIALAATTLDSFQGLLADASPTASLGSGGAEVQLGTQFNFTVSFSNPSTQEGYAPFIDVFMPATGRDGNDGASFVSATYLARRSTASSSPSMPTAMPPIRWPRMPAARPW